MFEKYYIKSPETYFHHSQYYDRSTDLYEEHNHSIPNHATIKKVFDGLEGNVLLSHKLIIGKPPRIGMQNPEDYDSQAWFHLIYEVFVIDSHKILNTHGLLSTPTHNLLIHQVYFGYQAPIPFYPESYSSIITENSCYGVVNSVKALFKDYINPRFGWLLSFHWNRSRSNTTIAEEILRSLQDDVTLAYDYLLRQRQDRCIDKGFNCNGSFASRLDFALAYLANERYKEGIRPQKKRIEMEECSLEPLILDVTMT